MLTLDPEIAAYLLERYPGTRREGIANMWACACAFVEERVRPMPVTPPAFNVAATFRMRAMCESDPARKASFLFCATEALAPYV
ncbi:hypothetical protein [Cognatiluteimonas weifangensis]|uniref:hypothetical protein n=1 Tax=Cognatiluteimonas weifangensis TaxID=2303539 RepID=UPI0011C14C45|nr:hypothetical protein [Luteimonas weifangensis]